MPQTEHRFTYSAQILDRNRELLAVLDRHGGFSFTRKPSTATRGEIRVPRNDEKIGHVQLGKFVSIFRHRDGDTSRRFTGVIVERDVVGDFLTLAFGSEETLLDWTLCPENYSPVLNGSDLADVVRRCLDDWHVLRVKAQEQWQSVSEQHGRRASSQNIDVDTLPGQMILATDGNNAYLPSGNAVFRFDRDEVPDFVEWDRVRWVSDYADDVRTTIQVSTQSVLPTSAEWNEIDEVRGFMPESLGWPTQGFSALGVDAKQADTVWIRVNLYTDDTTSPDDDDEPTQFGVTPRVHALELIARTQSEVGEGDIPASTGVTVRGLNANQSTSLEIIREACLQAEWEFVVDNGQLSLAENIGMDRSGDIVLTTGPRGVSTYGPQS